MKILWALLAVLAIAKFMSLADIKVKNELRMTQMYERQAVALERIADVDERAHSEVFDGASCPNGPAGFGIYNGSSLVVKCRH